jgi:hypothetical protein
LLPGNSAAAPIAAAPVKNCRRDAQQLHVKDHWCFDFSFDLSRCVGDALGAVMASSQVYSKLLLSDIIANGRQRHN